jgi:hypothetical protein
VIPVGDPPGEHDASAYRQRHGEEQAGDDK